MDRRVLNIFLASPGDLADERALLRALVERFNRAIARRIGWHVELFGWEDTLPGYARPQSIINRDVDSCDLFIGMLWRRWGQPTGEFSSGFEEEFSRARDRHLKTNNPAIWLLFKHIEEDALRDPGEQLKRVCQFHEQQVEKKELLFKEYKTVNDFESFVYDALFAYIHELNDQRTSALAITTESAEAIERPSDLDRETVSEERLQLYPKQLVDLFSQVVTVLPKQNVEKLGFWERTRLLLISSAWFNDRHATKSFDNHIMNLVFRRRHDWDLSDAERWFLLRSVIGDSYSHRPGWFWLQAWGDDLVDAALEELAETDSDSTVRKNALILLGKAASCPDNTFLKAVLSDKDDDVVTQAIDLLLLAENIDHLDLLNDLVDSANPKISGAAISAKIELLYLKEPDRAFEELVDRGLRIPKRISLEAKSHRLPVSHKLLMKALQAADPSVRQTVATFLLETKNLPKETAQLLLGDTDSQVRKVGVTALVELGEQIDMETIRKLFPDPKEEGPRSGLIANALLGGEPRVIASDLAPLILQKKSAKELLSTLDFFKLDSEETYRVLATKHFNVFQNQLRSDLDDNFESFLAKSKTRFREEYGASAEPVMQSWKPELVEFIRNKLVAAALEGLAMHGTVNDLKYARRYLGKTEYGMGDEAAIQLIAKFGDVSDVSRLLSRAESIYGQKKEKALLTAFRLSDNADQLTEELIKGGNVTAAKIAAEQLSVSQSQRKFELAQMLLMSEKDTLRLAGVGILAECCTKEKLVEFLDEYTERESYYYNVVAWIDRFLYAQGRYGALFKNELRSGF